MLAWAAESCRGYRIKIPPQYLEPHLYPCIEHIFLEKGAKISSEKNQHLAILNSDFSFHFSDTNKKIVRRCISKGYVVDVNSKVCKDGYRLLERNRAMRSVTLSLTFEEIERQSTRMQGRFAFFRCKDFGGDIIAYAVCIYVRSDVLYVLYWGEAPEHRKQSPVVYLAKCIIDYCIQGGIAVLDVGISSLNGILDQGLFDFKSRLGCATTLKYVIEGSYA
jgi:hypothetical protein